MNRCRNPEHPHCTVWVMPGEQLCAHGHAQPDPEPAAAPAAAGLPSSFEAISALRAQRTVPAPGPAFVPRMVWLLRKARLRPGFFFARDPGRE